MYHYLLLLYRKDDLLKISLPERYICAKGQDTQVSAVAVLIKDKPIPNVFQYRTNCLNATPMFEYRATGTAAVAMT